MDQRTTTPAPINSPFGAFPTFGYDALLAWNRPIIEAMSDLTNRTVEKSAAFGSAWSSLVQKRFQQGLDLQQRLATCRSPEEVMRVYGTWAQIAVEQYQAGFDEMARIGQDIQRETVEVVGETINGAHYPLERRAA